MTMSLQTISIIDVLVRGKMFEIMLTLAENPQFMPNAVKFGEQRRVMMVTSKQQ